MLAPTKYTQQFRISLKETFPKFNSFPIFVVRLLFCKLFEPLLTKKVNLQQFKPIFIVLFGTIDFY